MSERIVDSPANHGWVETDDGRWVWDAASGGSGGGSIQDGDTVGQVTTWSGAEWTPDSSLTIDATGDATFSGNLSIGGDVGRKFGVTSDQGIIGRFQSTNASYPGTITFANGNTAIDEGIRVGADADNFIVATGQGETRLTIDATGDATFTGHAQALGLVVRDGVVGQAGVGGTIYLSTNNSYTLRGAKIEAENMSIGNDHALHFYTNSAGQNPEKRLTIDSVGDATFSGTVDAAGFTVNGQPISGGGDLGSGFVLENESASADNKKLAMKVETSGALRIQALNDAGGGGGNYFQFNRNGNQVTQLGCYKNGGLVGQWDISTNTITATDFIATSDERAKDNITTAPVGLIDSLKGREWEWKESGEKGSGVVAQELEQVLPHLVHEDDEGMKSVSYMGLCAYLIEELKDCRERLAVLESKE